jgi:cation diffusion facilitator family transporter
LKSKREYRIILKSPGSSSIAPTVLKTLESAYKLTVLKRSAIAISSVIAVEIILGLLVNSLAIVSDGLHATLDALTTVILFLVTRISTKPPDEEHMYGHEKFEAVGGLAGGLALIGIAVLIVYEALVKILANQTVRISIEYVGFIAIGYTFCIDFFRVGTFFRARKSESSTLKAGLYHAVADLGSTIIALFGFGLATLGFLWGDSVASIFLGVMLTYLSLKLVWSSAMELSDTVPKNVAERIKETISATKEVHRIEDLKIRKAGEKTFVRTTVQIPDYLTLEEAHNLTAKIQAGIQEAVGNVDVVIQTKPIATEMTTERLIETLAKEVQGVEEVHEIDVTYASGKLYVTLHVYVDPKLSVKKAHEIADEIEGKIERRLRSVEDIAVHVEPFTLKERRGAFVEDKEIRWIIQAAASNYRESFRVKRIVTYVAGGRRYINIDCVFTQEMSIEEAHGIASQIETEIKKQFSETVVTVHVEPS